MNVHPKGRQAYRRLLALTRIKRFAVLTPGLGTKTTCRRLAVPIPPEDLIYGTKEATATRRLPLGTLSMRAEPSSLLISSSLFYRCRNTPFYHLMEDHLVKWLSGRILE